MKKFKLEFEMADHRCNICPHKQFDCDICRLCYRPIIDITTHPLWCPLVECPSLGEKCDD